MRDYGIILYMEVDRKMLTLITGLLPHTLYFVHDFIGIPVFAALMLIIAAFGFIYSLGHRKDL